MPWPAVGLICLAMINNNQVERLNGVAVSYLTAIDRHPWQVARAKILEWFSATGTAIPDNDDALLVTIHKMRVTINGISPDARNASIEWLRDRGVPL